MLKLLINPNLVRKYLHHLFQCRIMAWELAGGKDQHVQTLSSLNWINKYFLKLNVDESKIQKPLFHLLGKIPLLKLIQISILHTQLCNKVPLNSNLRYLTIRLIQLGQLLVVNRCWFYK